MSTSVRDLPHSRELVYVSPSCSAKDAAVLMEGEAVGCLAVQDDEGLIVGIVTDRDLALRVAGCPGAKPEKIEVAAVMSTPTLTVDGRESVDAAIRVMRERGVRRLIVTCSEGKPRSLLSLDDLIGELAGDLGSLDREVRSQIASSRRDARLAELRADIEESTENVAQRLRRASWLTKEALSQEITAIKVRIERALGMRDTD